MQVLYFTSLICYPYFHHFTLLTVSYWCFKNRISFLIKSNSLFFYVLYIQAVALIYLRFSMARGCNQLLVCKPSFIIWNFLMSHHFVALSDSVQLINELSQSPQGLNCTNISSPAVAFSAATLSCGENPIVLLNSITRSLFQIISYSSSRGGVSVATERGETSRSVLLIQKARPSDSGNYQCNPSNARPANVTVHVLNG